MNKTVIRKLLITLSNSENNLKFFLIYFQRSEHKLPRKLEAHKYLFVLSTGLLKQLIVFYANQNKFINKSLGFLIIPPDKFYG